MKRIARSVVLATFLASSIAPVLGHHSFEAEFDARAPVKFSGTLTRFDLVAPHSWIYIDVADEGGEITNWGVELGVPNMLIRQGVNKRSLTPGTVVVVEGFRARDGSPTATGRNVTFEDGRPIFSTAGR